MKMNWGKGIAIFYSCFVLVMLFMVVKSSQNNVHLVQDNYYEKDLNYEAFRKKRQNASDLKKPVVVKYNPSIKNIEFTFPDNMAEASGKIALFRPSNKHLDLSYDIHLDKNARMHIGIKDNTEKGLWYVQIDWKHLGKEYYSEESIIL